MRYVPRLYVKNVVYCMLITRSIDWKSNKTRTDEGAEGRTILSAPNRSRSFPSSRNGGYPYCRKYKNVFYRSTVQYCMAFDSVIGRGHGKKGDVFSRPCPCGTRALIGRDPPEQRHPRSGIVRGPISAHVRAGSRWILMQGLDQL